MLASEELSMILSSSVDSGAVNVSADGSSFEVHLQDPILIPADAHNVFLSVEQATIWWTTSNITEENNKFYIDAPDTLDVVQSYVLTIENGLYDLTSLNLAILRELENLGAKTSPEPVINMSPDSATSKVNIRFNYDTVIVDFTQNNTFREILGFDSQILGAYPSAPINVLADNVAAFNQINSFLLHTDLVTDGVRINNVYNNTVAQVLIDVPPGDQIVFSPFNPARINVPQLAGQTTAKIKVWLTDENNNLVDTNGEVYTLRLVIHYLNKI